MAGYEFAGGDFDHQRWGGLGLVLTGDRAADVTAINLCRRYMYLPPSSWSERASVVT